MAQKTIILHVGPHKTGTTSMQKFWSEHRQSLAAHGILYPGHEDSHNSLAHNLLGWRTKKFNRDQLLASIAASLADTVVLSSEDFAFLDAAQLERLRDLLQPHDVRIAYFLRRMPDALHSFWIESVKQGRGETFLEVADRFPRGQKSGRPSFNPRMQLTDLRDVFGSEALDVFPFDNILQTGSDLLGAFAARYFPVDVTVAGIKKKNPAPDMAQIELMRQINARAGKRTEQHWSSFPFRLLMKRQKHHGIDWFPDFRSRVEEQSENYVFAEGKLARIEKDVLRLVKGRVVGDPLSLFHFTAESSRTFRYVPAGASVGQEYAKKIEQLAEAL